VTDAPAPDKIEVSPAQPRRGWGQFSLLSLIILVVAGCLGAAWYGEKQRRTRAEAEFRKLRVELGIIDDRQGILDVSDRTKVHVWNMAPHNELEWRWRVFVPPGNTWHIRTSHGEEWDDEQNRFSGGGAGTGLDLDGEFNLEAQVVRNLDGVAYLEVRHGRGAMRSRLPDAGVEVLRGKGKRQWKVLGNLEQQSLANSGEIELLRWYRDSPTSAASGAPSPGFGISIHLEDEAHQQNRFSGR
jgi:hypothetical protein